MINISWLDKTSWQFLTTQLLWQYFCLFVCNRRDTIQYHGDLPIRRLGQATILVFLTPRQVLSSHSRQQMVDCIGYRIEIVPNIDKSSQFKLNQSTNLELLFTHSDSKTIKIFQIKPNWTDNLNHYGLTVAKQILSSSKCKQKKKAWINPCLQVCLEFLWQCLLYHWDLT